MTKLKLGPIQDDKPVRLTIVVAPSTWRALPRLREQIGVSSRVG